MISHNPNDAKQPPPGGDPHEARVAELEADLAAATAATVGQVGRALRAEIALRELHAAAAAVAACMAFVPPESGARVRRLREVLAAQTPAPRETDRPGREPEPATPSVDIDGGETSDSPAST